MDDAGLAIGEDKEGWFFGVVADGEDVGREEDRFQRFLAQHGGMAELELFIPGQEMFQGVIGGLFCLFVGEAEAIVMGERIFLGGGLGVVVLGALEVVEAEGFDSLDG
jgi:hypothetical protein